MNVNNFIDKILEYEKMPTIYKLGKFMNSYRKGKNGNYLECDCSGLIKGTLWGYPYNGNIYPDVNANSIMSNYCYNQSSDFSKISKGEFVWMNGHIGVYIGNGKVCECSPKLENGIQITNLNARNWKKHGFSKWLDYSSNSSGNSSKTWDIERIARDVINGKYGNGHETRKRNIGCDDATYQQIRKRVNELSK